MFTRDALIALLLSVVAGFSTMLGAFVVFFTKGNKERLLSASLGFAGGVMISVTFADLMPNASALFEASVSDKLSVVYSVAFLAVGVGVAALLDKLVPHQEYDEELGGTPHNDLFRVGIVSMLAIGLHNFPEGIATFMAGYQDSALGITIALAIALHNIPEGITVAMPVYFSTGSRKKAFYYTFLSGVSEPIGALLAFFLLQPMINDFILGALFAAVSGVMLYITLEELLPSSRQYGHDKLALWSSFLGIIIMPLSHLI